MKLTIKDKEFLEKLKKLMAERDLWVDLKNDGYKRMVLRGNYGTKIDKTFRMTRQGVRWRFQRLSDAYISALEAIYFVESTFGTNLRKMALEIARERIEMCKNCQKMTK